MSEPNRRNPTDEDRDVDTGSGQQDQSQDPFGEYYGPGGGQEGDFGEEYGNNFGYGREGEHEEGDDSQEENTSQSEYVNRYSLPEYTELDSTATGGPYAGVGPRGYQRSDARIIEDVSERLAHNGQIDASRIRVEVADRQVTLSGQVPDRHTKRMAEDVAASVSGVTEVHNHLKIHRDR